MATTPPALGYGQRGEAPIDAVNQWMRSQGWYAQLLSQWGQSPSNTHLSDWQKEQVLRAAQAHGVVVDEGGDGQEIDDSGNFRAKGHGLRNTLIVAGIAAAALATAGAAGAFAAPAAAAPATVGAVEGGAFGLPAAAAAALPGAAAVPSAVAGGSAAAASSIPAATYGPGGVVTNFANVAPDVASKVGTSSLTSDLLHYGLPTAGGIISGIVQANAAGSASDAQQKYLEEALAYEKEKDAGNISREASRYADFTKNINPYVDRGNAAGSRMSALLGLPAGAAPPATALGSSGGGAAPNPIDFADKLSAADKAKVDALLQKHNSSDNPNYWYGVNALHGGFDTTGADWNDHRIGIGDGAGKGYSGTPSPRQYGTQPVARTEEQPAAAPEMVTVQAPDGTQRTVSKAQADFYVSKGATIVGAAA